MDYKSYFTILIFMVLCSCETDFDVTASYKDTMVVYGLLDPTQEHQSIRINKSYLGREDAVPGPMDSFLVLRGIKTLHVRMQRHCDNAKEIAEFLNNHPKIQTVYYPGLTTHKNHEIAKLQMKDFGGMMSFSLKGDSLDDAIKIVSNTHFFTLAESLGGVESLCGHPATMTHAAIPKEERLKSGVTDSLIRLSVGIEDVDDLIYDLKSSLD